MRACHNCIHWPACNVREDDIACGIYKPQEKAAANPQTNADRIRAMSDEELMHLLFSKISCGSVCAFCVPTMRRENKCDGHCRNGVLTWLKQPVKDGEGE